jgi:class 3 adenylate cyclase
MTGNQEGDYYELCRGTNVIGRSGSLPIHILDMTISREHMKISFEEDREEYFVEDLNSRHGVFIDEIKLKGKRKLTEGSRITIGQINLLFTLENIADRKSALARLRISKPEFPTIDISINATRELDVATIRRGEIRLHKFKRWAGSEKITLAIVFTDMVDSTALIHELGNEIMDQIRRQHFSRARNLIEEHNGYEIKTNGDEFMVAFRTALGALDFVTQLQADTGDERIRIRAGVHIGPVIVEEEDIQGAAVSYAARIVAMAVNGGIWLSNEAKNHIDQEKARRHENLCWQQHPDCTLKGFPGKHLLWSVEEKQESSMESQ